jgi:hypothetical protein
MSFESMHNDWLDPDSHLNNEEDYGFENIQAELKNLSLSDPGSYDCVLTGKDSDLESTGRQSVKLVAVDEERCKCEVHIAGTIACKDVSLNTPARWPHTIEEVALERFTDDMELLVMVAQLGAEWDCDSWCVRDSVEFTVEVFADDDGAVDAKKTAEAIVEKAQLEIKCKADELAELNKAGERFAGWCDEKGNAAKPGKPPKCASFYDMVDGEYDV